MSIQLDLSKLEQNPLRETYAQAFILFHQETATEEEVKWLKMHKGELDSSLFFRLAEELSSWVNVLRKNQEWGIGLEIPARLQSKWSQFQGLQKRKEQWMLRILKSFEGAGIDVMPLKGGYLGLFDYKNISYKKMNDFDFLVRKKDVVQASRILAEMGFRSLRRIKTDQRSLDKDYHLAPYFTEDESTVLGLHWHLVSSNKLSYKLTESLWRRAKKKATVLGTVAYKLDPVHFLLHLCVHLPFYKIGVRELADLSYVIKTEPVDWEEFYSLTVEYGVESRCFRVLRLVKATFPASQSHLISDGVLDRLSRRSPGYWVRDTEARVRMGVGFVLSRSVVIGKIEKSYAISLLSKNYPEKVQRWAWSWQTLLNPPKDEVYRLTLQKKGFISTVNASWRLYCELIREHGFFTFWGMTMVHFLMVVLWLPKAALNSQGSTSNYLKLKMIKGLE